MGQMVGRRTGASTNAPAWYRAGLGDGGRYGARTIILGWPRPPAFQVLMWAGFSPLLHKMAKLGLDPPLNTCPFLPVSHIANSMTYDLLELGRSVLSLGCLLALPIVGTCSLFSPHNCCPFA